MQQNFIEKIENVSHLQKLRVLDIAMNQLKEIENLTSADQDNDVLTDLWLNQNHISSWTSIQYLMKLKALDTIYLHSNPVALIPAPNEETKEEVMEEAD